MGRNLPRSAPGMGTLSSNCGYQFPQDFLYSPLPTSGTICFDHQIYVLFCSLHFLEHMNKWHMWWPSSGAMFCLPAHSTKMLSFLGHVILSQHRRRRWLLPTQQWLKQTQLFIQCCVTRFSFKALFRNQCILGHHALPINSGAKMEELQGCRHIWEQMVTPTAVSREAGGHIYLMCGWWAYLYDVFLSDCKKPTILLHSPPWLCTL